jgi:hypothetical protein
MAVGFLAGRHDQIRTFHQHDHRFFDRRIRDVPGHQADESLEEASPALAATIKDCPHCLMSVPLQATRRGHCASDLKAA